MAIAAASWGLGGNSHYQLECLFARWYYSGKCMYLHLFRDQKTPFASEWMKHWVAVLLVLVKLCQGSTLFVISTAQILGVSQPSKVAHACIHYQCFAKLALSHTFPTALSDSHPEDESVQVPDSLNSQVCALCKSKSLLQCGMDIISASVQDRWRVCSTLD